MHAVVLNEPKPTMTFHGLHLTFPRVKALDAPHGWRSCWRDVLSDGGGLTTKGSHHNGLRECKAQGVRSEPLDFISTEPTEAARCSL